MQLYKDADELSEIYDRYAPMLYRVAFSYVKNKEDAEDVVSDVFLKYIKHIVPFHDEEHRRAWFLRVTINQCHDALRKKKTHDYIDLDEVSETLEVDSEKDTPNVFAELVKLPEKYRIAIMMHYLEGYSVEETAAICRCSESAMKMRLQRGRQMLALQLK